MGWRRKLLLLLKHLWRRKLLLLLKHLWRRKLLLLLKHLWRWKLLLKHLWRRTLLRLLKHLWKRKSLRLSKQLPRWRPQLLLKPLLRKLRLLLTPQWLSLKLLLLWRSLLLPLLGMIWMLSTSSAPNPLGLLLGIWNVNRKLPLLLHPEKQSRRPPSLLTSLLPSNVNKRCLKNRFSKVEWTQHKFI